MCIACVHGCRNRKKLHGYRGSTGFHGSINSTTVQGDRSKTGGNVYRSSTVVLDECKMGTGEHG